MLYADRIDPDTVKHYTNNTTDRELNQMRLNNRMISDTKTGIDKRKKEKVFIRNYHNYIFFI
jgi:hypothetical protein